MPNILRKIVWVAGGILLLLALTIGAATFSQSRQEQPTPLVSENSVEALRGDLSKITKVPLALPTKIPAIAQPYYAAVIEAKTDRYSLSLDSTKDCYGTQLCSFGMAMGELAPSQSIDEEFGNDPQIKPVAKSANSAQTVQLAHRIEGRYIPYVCGANCSDSKIVWEQGGYRYMVGAKGGYLSKETELNQLIEMANSAIEGRR